MNKMASIHVLRSRPLVQVHELVHEFKGCKKTSDEKVKTIMEKQYSSPHHSRYTHDLSDSHTTCNEEEPSAYSGRDESGERMSLTVLCSYSRKIPMLFKYPTWSCKHIRIVSQRKRENKEINDNQQQQMKERVKVSQRDRLAKTHSKRKSDKSTNLHVDK